MGDRRRQRLGLRWKFNLTLLPAVAMTVLLLAWVDTAHERQAVSAAHGQHAPAAGAPAEPGPVDPTASPAAAVRRSAVIHAVYAIALLSLIAIGLNTALSQFVLKPIALMDDDIENLERGRWRLPVRRAGRDEIGRAAERVQSMGLTVDALVGHMIRAERMATMALLARRMTAQIEPRVERIAAAVSRLNERADGSGRDAEGEIATASAEILMAVRDLNRACEANLSSTGRRRTSPAAVRGMGRSPCLTSDTASLEKIQG